MDLRIGGWGWEWTAGALGWLPWLDHGPPDHRFGPQQIEWTSGALEWAAGFRDQIWALLANLLEIG